MKYIPIIILIPAILLSGCGPNPEEIALISIGETAMAATPAPTPSPCPDISVLEGNFQDMLPFNMEVKSFPSENTDRTYHLYISLPINYHFSTNEYSVIYVLDGDILFGTTKELVHGLSINGDIPDQIVVGIGYKTNDLEDIFSFRAQEYNPNGILNDQYKSFLMDELIPYIEMSYRVDTLNRTIVGYSYSGIFVLDFMFEYPDIFNKIVAGSPFVIVNNRQIFTKAEEFAEGKGELPVNLYIAVGGNEDDRLAISKLTKDLEASEINGLNLTFEIIEGEGHNSVMPFVLSKGIRAVNQ